MLRLLCLCYLSSRYLPVFIWNVCKEFLKRVSFGIRINDKKHRDYGIESETFVRDVRIEVPNWETLRIAVSSSLEASSFA